PLERPTRRVGCPGPAGGTGHRCSGPTGKWRPPGAGLLGVVSGPVGPGRADGRSAPAADHPTGQYQRGGTMTLIFESDGRVRGIYGEEIALDALGRPRISRASHVEPDNQGRWLADLSPVGGPVLGPFDRRSEALEAEVAWLEEHWLGPAGPAH